MDKRVPSVIPEKLTGLRLGEPSDYAAGGIAVQKAIEHLSKEMGPIRAWQAINKMNKKNGFDCPGCAWPDPDDKRSVLGEYCENGAKALAEEATRKKIGLPFFELYNITDLRRWSDFELGKSGRLTEPLITRDGKKYSSIGWEEAFALIARHLKALDDPNKAIFYTSGRSSNEAAYLYGLLARRLGTNNLPDCSNMCHESSGVALSETLGIGKGSVTLDDFNHAEVIMIIGQNPGTNHPRMLTALQNAKKNGAKVITINPLAEAGLKKFKNPQKIEDWFTGGTQITDVHLQVKINEDITLLKSIMIALIDTHKSQGDVIDESFIKEKTEGYNALVEDLLQYSIPELIQKAGIAHAVFQQALDILIPAKKIIICWAMGLTQHKNGVENIKECVNLLLLKGSIGKKGAGTCPVRGHSNVQGDRTVGINHKIPTYLAHNIQTHYGFKPPMETGLDTVHSIKALHQEEAKIFMALGGNLLSAASDTDYTAKALQNGDLTVYVSTKLNRSHLYPGKIGLILPTLGRSEIDRSKNGTQYVSVENSMGVVHKSSGTLAPSSEKLKSEVSIICEIGHAIWGTKCEIPWRKYQTKYTNIRDSIEKVVKGFTGFNKRLASNALHYLPNNARVADFAKLPNGRAQFYNCTLPTHNLKENEFLLMSIRSHDQFNTTIYGLDDRYRGIYNERRVIFMHPNDIEKLGLKKEQLVDIYSHYNNKERIVRKFHVVPYNIPESNLAAYFPEINPVIPIDEFAYKSQTPISKSIRVTIK